MASILPFPFQEWFEADVETPSSHNTVDANGTVTAVRQAGVLKR